MVSCKHCSTPNSLDSTFCKRCGTALPEEDVQVAQEKLTALIADGNTAFNEGRTDEALAVADSALLSNPSSISALSLKALCHERRGELAEALECADQIVDLNPDSELDKIKRNQLRTKLSVSVQLATQPPDRRTALIGAVATVILVLCIGIGVAKVVNRGEASKVGNIALQSDSGTRTNTPSQAAPPVNSSGLQPVQQPVQQPTADDSAAAERSAARTPPRYAVPGGGILPETGNDPTDPMLTLEGPISPLRPPTPNAVITPSSVKTPTPLTPDKGSTTEDPAPTADQHGGSTVDQGPGMVDIQISSGSKRTFGGGMDSSSGAGGAGGAKALEKVGIQRFSLGSYGSASASFEQALRAGGDPVAINQYLGRCYDHLNRKSDEIEAYRRCVAACQAAISRGTGNKDRINAIMDTCQQELKVLQGN
jgi:tetratricopeptide (TPR) repeat protein